MALLDLDAIATRARVVLAGAVLVRGVASTRFLADYHTGLSDDAKAERVIVKPRYEVRVWDAGRNEASPPLYGTVAIKNVAVEVVIARPLTFSEATIDSIRDDATSLAAQDFDCITQALSWPGNMTGCGLSNDLLMGDGEPTFRIQTPDGERPGLIETVHRLSGIAIVTMAIS